MGRQVLLVAMSVAVVLLWAYATAMVAMHGMPPVVTGP